MIKVIVVGKNGLLGSNLIAEIKKLSSASEINLISWGRFDCDITNPEVVANKISAVKPDLVVNCAGLTNVDLCETDPHLANQINAEAVKSLANACKQVGAKLIQISTDYIFPGNAPDGYTEESQPKPINKYGVSKLKAEKYLQAILPNNHAIIRISWLFGVQSHLTPERKDFIKNLIDWSTTNNSLKILNNQYGCATSAQDVSHFIIELIAKWQSGIFHVANSGVHTRYDLAQEVFKILKEHKLWQKIPIITPATLEDLKIKWDAPRPTYSVLVNTKIQTFRSWQKALEEYLLAEYN